MDRNSDDLARPWKALIKFGAGLVVASVVGLMIVIGGSFVFESCAS